MGVQPQHGAVAMAVLQPGDRPEPAAGTLGRRQGQALFLLQLSVEAAQPGTAGGRDQGGVEEPVEGAAGDAELGG
ncbi:hypothetical protein, partial [Amycolatopsis mediterranei]|uniref:hypothetical protein n=1 Tax=Amycolatopsis mediterranei TaxID=33910 RepID=UPI00331E4684